MIGYINRILKLSISCIWDCYIFLNIFIAFNCQYIVSVQCVILFINFHVSGYSEIVLTNEISLIYCPICHCRKTTFIIQHAHSGNILKSRLHSCFHSFLYGLNWVGVTEKLLDMCIYGMYLPPPFVIVICHLPWLIQGMALVYEMAKKWLQCSGLKHQDHFLSDQFTSDQQSLWLCMYSNWYWINCRIPKIVLDCLK